MACYKKAVLRCLPIIANATMPSSLPTNEKVDRKKDGSIDNPAQNGADMKI